MKLGSLREGGPDGTLVVVDRELMRAACVPGIARTMQSLLDRWDECAGRLREAYDLLNAGEMPDDFPLDLAKLAAPLPRAYARCVAAPNMPSDVPGPGRADPAGVRPRMYRASSDHLLGPRDDIWIPKAAWSIAVEPSLAAITGEVPMATPADDAGRFIRMIALTSEVVIREFLGEEREAGTGPLRSHPTCAFSPVVVTPDELGEAWDGGRVSLPLVSQINGMVLNAPEIPSAPFDFPSLIAHAAETRPLLAGTIIGIGLPANTTPARVLRAGDRWQLEMRDDAGRSPFGSIDQRVVRRDENV